MELLDAGVSPLVSAYDRCLRQSRGVSQSGRGSINRQHRRDRDPGARRGRDGSCLVEQLIEERLMRLKVTPNVGPRYWAAILIASMCGTNLGDIIPDVLKVSAGSGLIMLAFMFALLMSAERATARGSEAFYW